jgi:hypothetical protein
LLAARECSNTSRTSFQLEKTSILAAPSVEVILKILLVTASILIQEKKKIKCIIALTEKTELETSVSYMAYEPVFLLKFI